MSRKPDPQKAIYLKPHQRTVKKKKVEQERPLSPSPWQPHPGNVVYDAWGAAIRAMRAEGVSWE
ncbi:MAG: hypothetical protein IAF02_26605 [Anaerolineae bacterium]|nr:hypothetical protein [Anaerolineae bacterium]